MSIRLRLIGATDARRQLGVLLRRRRAITFEMRPNALIIDLPVDRIEHTGPSIEARAIALDLELWLDDLDALVLPADLDSYGSRIWPALGDAFVRNELARGRGEEPSVDPYAFVRVTERDGRRIAEDARASWDPPTREPLLGPPHWTDIPSPDEIEAAIGPGHGIVTVELFPDRPPVIGRLANPHEDSALEGRLPEVRTGEAWPDVSSHRRPGDRRVRAALRDLGVDPKTCSEVFALHGSGHGVLVARLLSVPGIDARSLRERFVPTALSTKRQPLEPAVVAGVDAMVSVEHIAGCEHHSVVWSDDGIVAVFGGEDRQIVEGLLEAFVANARSSG